MLQFIYAFPMGMFLGYALLKFQLHLGAPSSSTYSGTLPASQWAPSSQNLPALVSLSCSCWQEASSLQAASCIPQQGPCSCRQLICAEQGKLG